MALNVILGVAAEAVSAAAEVMLLPGLILAFFVAELTPAYTLIGLVPAIAASFWALARLPAALVTTSWRRQRPWAFAAALVRAGAIAVLAVVASRTDPNGLSQTARPLMVTFFLCLIVFSLAGGFGSVPNAALLRAAVPVESWESFARRRSIVSALIAVLAGLVVARLLGTNALAFPGNYGRLFLVATVCLIAVAAFTTAMREPWSAVAGGEMPIPSPRLLRQPLYDARFRRFLFFRILFSATAAVDPFLFLYAVTRLGAPVTAIGNYVLAGVLGWVLSAPIWAWLEHRSGARLVLQGASVVRLVAPAVALVLPQLAAVDVFRERLTGMASPTSIYGLVFFAIGAAMAAQSRGNFDYVAALAPPPLLSVYAGLANVVLAIVAFAPVLGGVVIQRSGYEAFFGVAAILGLAAVFAGGWLAETPSARGQPRDWGAEQNRRALAPGRV